MKKFYALSLVLISAVSFGQSIVITKVVDGTLPHGGCEETDGTFSPRIVEMYVSGTIDFGSNTNDYRLQVESNGAATEADEYWGGIGMYMSDFGEVTDSFIYAVNMPDNDGTPFYEGALPIFEDLYPGIDAGHVVYSGYAPNPNGNDAIRVANYDGENLIAVIDQYGNPLEVTGGGDFDAAWAYQDSYAARNNGVTANGGNFDSSSFTYGGNDALDEVDCNQFTTAVPMGEFSILGTEKFDPISGIKMYPNPLTGSTLNITSDNDSDKTVAIYDVLGKQVVNTVAKNGTINVSNLTSGVYIVKITEEGRTATRKLVVK